jgi:hypothetical protein
MEFLAMARRLQVVPDNNGDGDGGPAAGPVKVISERDLAALVKKCKTAQAGMDSERATLGSYISDAVENKHLHKGAFGIFRRLEKMDDVKRQELLFHFDVYRERAKWNEADLFRPPQDAAE